MSFYFPWVYWKYTEIQCLLWIKTWHLLITIVAHIMHYMEVIVEYINKLYPQPDITCKVSHWPCCRLCSWPVWQVCCIHVYEKRKTREILTRNDNSEKLEWEMQTVEELLKSDLASLLFYVSQADAVKVQPQSFFNRGTHFLRHHYIRDSLKTKQLISVDWQKACTGYWYVCIFSFISNSVNLLALRFILK